MKYSDAFESLHEMSLKTDIITSDKCHRVAFFLGRIVIYEKYGNYKDDAIRYLIEMPDNEWNIIQELMERHADSSVVVTKERRTMRIDWIRALDTIRAFN